MLQGRPIVVRNGMRIDESGTLAGSHLDMAQAVRNATSLLGLELREAVRMASECQAAFLGLENQLGKITPGYRASLAQCDAELQVIGTWVDGKRFVSGTGEVH